MPLHPQRPHRVPEDNAGHRGDDVVSFLAEQRQNDLGG